MGSHVRNLLFLLALAHMAFGQVQITIFAPQNVSTNSIVSLDVELMNNGSLDRTQVRAFLSSLDPNIKVSKGYEYVGSLGRDSAQNVSFAFLFGNRSGTYPMQILVYDSRGVQSLNFSASSTTGIGQAGRRDAVGDEVFLAYERVSALSGMFDEIFRNAADCKGDGFGNANRSYSLARGHLSLAQQSYANGSYSSASQSAKLAVEWTANASESGKSVLESQRKCIEDRRLLLLEGERENFHRNISQYKRALSNLHVLASFFEAHGMNMSMERSVEQNVASNIGLMEAAVEKEGGMARASELANATEVLLRATPSLFEGRLGVIGTEIEGADYMVAQLYLRLDDASGRTSVAGSQLSKVSKSAREAGAELEKARASLSSAKAYITYKDFLFFSASAVERVGAAEKILADAGARLDNALEFADYRAGLGKLVLFAVLALLALGVFVSVFLHGRGKWKVVESARGFHYKKHS